MSSKMIGKILVVIYLLGWVFFSKYPEHSIWLFMLTLAGVWYISRFSNADDRPQLWIIGGTFVIPALVTAGFHYFEVVDTKRFKKYLATHDCEYAYDDVVAIGTNACSRFEQCDDDDEITEPVYFCAATDSEISLSSFRNGIYSR